MVMKEMMEGVKGRSKEIQQARGRQREREEFMPKGQKSREAPALWF